VGGINLRTGGQRTAAVEPVDRRFPCCLRIGEDVDRRKSLRYELRVPVVFRWDDGHVKHAGGFSRDLSPAGAYVSCDEQGDCPGRGATVEMELLLPPIDAKAQGLRLKAEAEVVRTNSACEPLGFAVRSNFSANADNGDDGDMDVSVVGSSPHPQSD